MTKRYNQSMVSNFRSFLKGNGVKFRNLVSHSSRSYAPWDSVEAIPNKGLVRYDYAQQTDVVILPAEKCSHWLLWDSPLAAEFDYELEENFE